jgi:hypothetical protein
LGVIKKKPNMPNNGLNIRIAAPLMMVAVLLVALLVSSGCYNSKTGEVKVGGAISFELPSFAVVATGTDKQGDTKNCNHH